MIFLVFGRSRNVLDDGIHQFFDAFPFQGGALKDRGDITAGDTVMKTLLELFLRKLFPGEELVQQHPCRPK